jgi:hypothetical protein
MLGTRSQISYLIDELRVARSESSKGVFRGPTPFEDSERAIPIQVTYIRTSPNWRRQLEKFKLWRES